NARTARLPHKAPQLVSITPPPPSPPPFPYTTLFRSSVRATLGDAADGVALSATKSMTGHLLGGAGALESIFTILALHDRKAPPTINVSDPDPELVLDLVRDTPRELPEGDVAAINNSFGFGGHNVALLFTTS